MLKIELINNEYRPTIICDWCKERIAEDIEGNYAWQVHTEKVISNDIIFLHNSCARDYMNTYTSQNSKWELRRLSEFPSSLSYSLEVRKPLNELHIKLREPTTRGRLYYCTDPDVADHLIYLRSLAPSKEIGHSINVKGGTVLFGADEYHLIRSVEVIIPKHHWVIDPLLYPPNPNKLADIELIEVSHRKEWIEWQNRSITVISNEIGSYIKIVFGEPETTANWIELSEQCLAMVIEDRLNGFFIKLI